MTREAAIKIVQDAILESEQIDPHLYKLEETYTEVGIDSLSLVSISCCIEDKLFDMKAIPRQVEFSKEQLNSIKTINDIVKLVERAGAECLTN